MKVSEAIRETSILLTRLSCLNPNLDIQLDGTDYSLDQPKINEKEIEISQNQPWRGQRIVCNVNEDVTIYSDGTKYWIVYFNGKYNNVSNGVEKVMVMENGKQLWKKNINY